MYNEIIFSHYMYKTLYVYNFNGVKLLIIPKHACSLKIEISMELSEN